MNIFEQRHVINFSNTYWNNLILFQPYIRKVKNVDFALTIINKILGNGLSKYMHVASIPSIT